MIASIALAGCGGGFDEAKERAACERANPGNKAKVDECFNRNKLANDKNLKGIAGALSK